MKGVGSFVFTCWLFGAPLSFSQTNLQFLSSTSGAACYAVAYANGHLFAGAGNTLIVYDVSSGTPPYQQLFEHRFESNITCLKVKGSKLFVAANHAGISMWDINAPAVPSFIDGYLPDSLNEAAYDLAFKGDSIFVSYKNKMALFKDNGASLSLLNRFAYQTGNSIVRGCDVKGNYLAFTTAYGANAQTGVHLLDASTLSQYFFYQQNYCDPEDVLFGQNNSLLHVLGGTESWFNADPKGLFYSLSISNPNLPGHNFIDTLKGITYLAVAQPQRAQIINDTVYLATVAAYNTAAPFPITGNVFVYDATVASSVHKLTDIYAGLWHFDLAVTNHKLFVASEWYGVKTLDISDIYNEQDLGNTLTGGWNTSADKHKNRLVVANEGYGFKLFDITDIHQPVLLDTSNEQGFCYGVSFSENGNYIYGYFYTGADFRVYDANSLNLVSSLDINPIPVTTDWFDAQLWHSKAINIEAASFSQKKITVLDVNNPLQPFIDTQFVAAQVNDILVTEAGKLLIANNGNIQIYDLVSRSLLLNFPLAFQNVTAIAFYNDTLYANVSGLFPGLRKYVYNGSNQLTFINSTAITPANPKYMAADAFGLYLDYQEEGLFAYHKSTLAQSGYYRHSMEFYRPDQWGQKMLLCKDSLILLSEYFGQTSLLTNCDGYFTERVALDFPQVNFSVFPNPCNDKLRVSIKNREAEFLEIELCDLMGKKIKTLFQGKNKTGEFTYTFDMSGINAGYYFVRVKMNNHFTIKSVCVLR